MEWRQITSKYFTTTGKAYYDVEYFETLNFWIIRYGFQGYVSRKLKVTGSFTYLINSPDCQFNTKEEAFSICERHHKLLLLQ